MMKDEEHQAHIKEEDSLLVDVRFTVVNEALSASLGNSGKACDDQGPRTKCLTEEVWEKGHRTSCQCRHEK